MAPTSLDIACPMAGCGGSTYLRRDDARVCMCCGHELSPEDLPSRSWDNRRPHSSHYFSQTGLAIAGLVASVFVFPPQDVFQQDAVPSQQVSVDPSTRDWTGAFVSLMRADVSQLSLEKDFPDWLVQLSRKLQHQLQSAPGTANNEILNYWIASDAETKRVLTLLLNEMVGQNPTLGPVVYPIVGHLLLAGVEHDELILRRLVGSLVWADDQAESLLPITQYIVEFVLRQGTYSEWFVREVRALAGLP